MRTRLVVVVVVILHFCVISKVHAQNPCRDLVRSARQSQDVYKMKAVLDVRLTPACVVELLLLRKDSHLLNSIVMSAYKNATSKVQQNGSSAGTGGSTNLISKGLTSKLLSLASEYGALTQTSSGQTTTFSGAMDGIPLALEAHTFDLIAECPLNLLGTPCIRSGLLDVLGKISYSISLNTTQASQLKGTATGTMQGTAQQVSVQSTGSQGTVSQVTGKVVIWKPAVKFKTLSDALQKLDANDPSKVQPTADALKSAFDVLVKYQQNAGTRWEKWRDDTAASLVMSADVLNDWASKGDSLAKVLEEGQIANNAPTDDELTQAALNYAAAYATFVSAERLFFESSTLTKPVLTFEYDENRPNSQPTNSVFRIIYNQTVKGWTLTGNGAASIYDSTPASSIPGSQKLRDVQLGAQGDHSVGKWGILGSPTFSVAYYFQDQTSPAILNVTPSGPVSGVTFAGLSSNASQVFAKKGNIQIGQLRLTLGDPKSGWSVPISITGSSRTELITATKLGGQVGISYDFDSLFKK